MSRSRKQTPSQNRGYKACLRSLSPWILEPAGSLLISALLLIVCFWLLQPTPPKRFQAPAKTWHGKSLTLVSGRGYYLGDRLVLQALDSTAYAVTREFGNGLDPSNYRFFVLDADGLWPGTKLSFIWRTTSTPAKLNHIPIPWDGGSTASVSLESVPKWSGDILEIGLAVGGRMERRISVKTIELAPYSFGTLLRTVLSQWMSFEGWRQSSINFLAGGIRRPLVFCLPVAAAWVGLALLILIFVRFARTRRWRWHVIPVICLVGWVVLDLRWQVDLFRQLRLTLSTYAGKDSDEKRLAERDRSFFIFAESVKKELPSSPQRIFLVSDEKPHPGRKLLRTEYFLRPHNVYIDTHVVSAPVINEIGGYVVVLGKDQMVSYDDRTHKLRWLDGQYLSAAMLLDTKIGNLYRVGTTPSVSGD